MNIEIKNRFTGDIIVAGEYDSVRRAVTKHKADLCGANLCGADLSDANLYDANLRGANLYDADLSGADLCGADLCGANLCGANLYDADLSGADLSGANLSDAIYGSCTSFLALQCPEEGAFTAWKKCKSNVIVKLLIPDDAQRSSATSRKCRASKAIVLDVIGADIGVSDRGLEYRKGETVYPDSWDDNRWAECSHGIHFFITRREAELYS